jgi:hypothetical protein
MVIVAFVILVLSPVVVVFVVIGRFFGVIKLQSAPVGLPILQIDAWAQQIPSRQGTPEA